MVNAVHSAQGLGSRPEKVWWRANRIDIGPITDAGETLLVSQVALFYHRCRESLTCVKSWGSFL